MNPTTKLRIAVDIGGTFTDVAVAGEGGAILATTKTPTTPENPTEGALTGTRRALDDIGAGFDDVLGFIHGTTLATNALIERRGARVAAVTTQGFRDILEIAYERRYDQYDINLEKPDLIVPRFRCFTVPERISARGEVLTPLDDTALDRLIDEIDASGAEAISICLLHAYANPSHEQRLGEIAPDAVFELGRRADSSDAQALVLSCTDMRSVETLERLEQAIGKPVVSSNQAMILAALALLRLPPGRNHCGRLFAQHTAAGTMLANNHIAD